jgi:RNA polymerase sigma-70 factor (ECF subfamily)
MSQHSSRASRQRSAVGSPAVQRRVERRIVGSAEAGAVRTLTPVSLAAPQLSVAATEPAPVLTTAAAFRRYAPYVAKIGMRILGRRDEIDDFVQDVFVQVHRHLDTLREPAALKGWLAKLAVHEATRRLRRKRVRAFFGMHSAHDYSDVADGAASPEQRALLTRVFSTLDALPAPERVAWALRHLEGETMERVAELCGCSLSTAKRRVAEAERVLAKLGVGRA